MVLARLASLLDKALQSASVCSIMQIDSARPQAHISRSSWQCKAYSTTAMLWPNLERPPCQL